MKKYTDKDWINCGYANGWTETPERVKEAEEAHAKWEEISIGRCITEYVCREYKVRYRVDSSD